MAYTSKYPPFAVTVDAVVLATLEGEPHALVVKRGSEPFKGSWALPGGFVDPDEDLCPAVMREVAEETGVHIEARQFQQLGAYGRPDRDPRMRTVSVAYLATLPSPVDPVGGDDAADAQWKPVTWLLAESDRLGFDHGEILRDGVERAKATLR